MRVDGLPRLKPGYMADLDAFRHVVKKHFDTTCNNQAPIIRDRPVAVVDVNFGMNDYETIRLKKVAGSLAVQLDLETEKLSVMKLRGRDSHSVADLERQEAAMRASKVEFVRACERAKVRPHPLEAYAAFLTFDSEEGYERCLAAYSSDDPALHLKGHKLKVTKAAPPSDYIWENFGMSGWERFLRICFSNIISIGIILCTIVLTIKVKQPILSLLSF